MASPGGVIRSVDKAAEDAFRAGGRLAGQAIGNIIAPVIGGRVVGAIGDALGWLAYRVGQLFAAALVANFILTVVVAAILVVFVAFALFVINSGAYIVPPGSLNQLPPSGNWPTIDVGASCPIPNGQILWGSLGNPNTPVQHGSVEYWARVAPAQCFQGGNGAYPLGGCFAIGSQCTPGCPTYGFAADIVWPGNRVVGQPVFYPYIGGESVTWTCSNCRLARSGQGTGFLRAVGPGGEVYEMYVSHLQTVPVGGVSGEQISTLYPLATPHLHIELRIDGEYVPPEFMCTGGGIGG